MKLTELSAISPVDGRYRKKVEELAPFFSEFGLIRYRVFIEIEYFIELCQLHLKELSGVDAGVFEKLRTFYTEFTEADAAMIKDFEKTTDELVAQQWIGLFAEHGKSLTIINDSTYGFDHDKGKLRISALRSPAHAGHPVEGHNYIVRQDRFEPRIDQGERVLRFWMNAGDPDERLERIDMEARLKNVGLMTVSANPPGKNVEIKQGVTISDAAVGLVALKKAEEDEKIIIRMFESTGKRRKVKVSIPYLDKKIDMEIDPFEIKSIAIDIENKQWQEVDLLECQQSSK